jgi:ABC-type branched-subunit amino acid transport system substrate-binding protein
MFALLPRRRKSAPSLPTHRTPPQRPDGAAVPAREHRVGRRAGLRGLVAGVGLMALAACDPAQMGGLGIQGAGNTGPSIDTSAPVPVALLVPRSDANAAAVARSLENAARLAVADLQGATIDLRVYDTAGNAAQAAQVAQAAVDDGAKIILGPLYGEAANAAGVAVADDGINVLAFSNNPSIAGGNVFILGATFRNTANRVTDYMRRTDRDDLVILHSNDVPGQFGRSAIQAAAAGNGVTVAGTVGYDLNQQSLNVALTEAARTVAQTGASTVMTTADYDGALALILELLPEKGVSPETTTYAGLTRWDTRPDAFRFTGLQNSLFAMPDQAMVANFRARYEAAYGARPHQLGGLAFDGIAAIGALVAQGQSDALTGGALTQSSGFQGVGGVFRLRPDGTNERGLSIATIRDGNVVILEQAPQSFRGPGF